MRKFKDTRTGKYPSVGKRSFGEDQLGTVPINSDPSKKSGRNRLGTPAGFPSEGWPDSRRNSGRFGLGTVAELGRNTQRKVAQNDQWVGRVQAIRKVVFDKREKVIVSPRASYHGADLLRAGFLQSKVEDMVIWKGINKEVKNRILAEV